MRSRLALIAVCGAASLSWGLDAIPKDAVPLPQTVFNFDRDAVGTFPERFTPAVTGAGPDFHWEVRKDPEAPSKPNVLVQSGKAQIGDNFALALLDGATLDHAEIAVRFKVLSGEDGPTAGMVWGYHDPQNYYVVCTNAHDDAGLVYRVKKGQVKLIDNKSMIVSPYQWHDLRLIFVRGGYTAFLDGELALGGKESSFRDGGQVGLWTRSDSVVAFDDFRVSK